LAVGRIQHVDPARSKKSVNDAATVALENTDDVIHAAVPFARGIVVRDLFVFLRHERALMVAAELVA
jgi:hypothetical protein